LEAIMVSVQSERHVIAQEIASVTPLSEAAAALAVIVLAVLGLVDVVPTAMLGIATIVVGAGLLLQGTKMAAEYSRILGEEGAAGNMQSVGGGITLEFLAGGAGIVLGILSLFAHAAELAPAALIVFGGTLLLGGGVAARIGFPAEATPGAETVAMMVRQSAAAAAGAQVFIGIAAIVLGILSFAVAYGHVLVLVGLLAVGAGLLITGITSASAVVSHTTH
jgi:hypothetical protein